MLNFLQGVLTGGPKVSNIGMQDPSAKGIEQVNHLRHPEKKN